MMKSTIESLKKAYNEDNDKQSNIHMPYRQVVNTCRCEVQEDGSVCFESQEENILQDATNNALSFLFGEWQLEPGDIFYLLSEIRCNENLYRANKTCWSASTPAQGPTLKTE